MNRAALQRGTLLRYAYLWSREFRRGQVEATKDRPTLVLSLAVRLDNGRTRLLVVPVTHTPPAGLSDAIEMPLAVKRSLGLDKARAWIVTTESNTFTWPGPDLRPIPGRPPGTFIYGQVPKNLLDQVIESFVRNKRRAKIVRRDE